MLTTSENNSSDTAMDEPRALAQSLIENLVTQQDASLVLSISELWLKTSEARSNIICDAQAHLSALTQRHKQAEIQAHQPSREREIEEYASQMSEMQLQEKELKQIVQESTDSYKQLTTKVDMLLREITELDMELEKASEAPPDEQMIKLSLLRSLGVEFLDYQDGTFSKCQVRSSGKNDIHTVQFDPKFSKFFYSNLLWDMCT